MESCSLQHLADSTYVNQPEFATMLTDFFAATRPKNEAEFVSRTAHHFSSYLRSRHLFETYLEFVFSVIEVFRSTRSDLIRSALEDFIELQIRFHKWSYKQSSTYRRNRSPALVNTDLLHECQNETFFCPFVWSPILLEYDNVMVKQLRYGSKLEFHEESFRDYPEYTIFLLLNYMKISRLESKHALDITINSYTTLAVKKRMYFVFLFLNAMVMKKMGCLKIHDCNVRNLKLLFKTIPEPLITVTEIFRFLKIITKDIRKEKTEEICNTFVDIFPRGAETFQPRTLLHLCRCQVRDSLASAEKLPHGVWDLRIPKRLMNYILLQRTKDEFHLKYVATLSNILNPETENTT